MEEVRLEAGRIAGRPLHPDGRETREAWTRRVRRGQMSGSAFPGCRGGRGLDRLGVPGVG